MGKDIPQELFFALNRLPVRGFGRHKPDKQKRGRAHRDQKTGKKKSQARNVVPAKCRDPVGCPGLVRPHRRAPRFQAAERSNGWFIRLPSRNRYRDQINNKYSGLETPG
ncbi:hypothetical protein GCM10011316_13050 [Roseibium aquae]|uniref:Uncharacterized protein n=1 Tax=Roseibium aquae TaxID=1323746 RepID=A0A916TF67_9HYPH|nr:hypothetical protein GCM10011316_13050 [Roseibium aquae]